jgi:hypothetical protein
MTMHKPYHEMATIPEAWTPAHWDGEGESRRVVNDLDPYKWSGSGAPPPVGATVTCTINRFGRGTVTGYFAEHGWLGVLVTLAKPPAWWRKQNPGRKTVHLFGIELAAS